MIPRVKSKENYKQSGMTRGLDRRFRRSSSAARLRYNTAEWTRMTAFESPELRKILRPRFEKNSAHWPKWLECIRVWLSSWRLFRQQWPQKWLTCSASVTSMPRAQVVIVSITDINCLKISTYTLHQSQKYMFDVDRVSVVQRSAVHDWLHSLCIVSMCHSSPQEMVNAVYLLL